MQKKLIALAVAGLLSAPAFAQSNVTLYGTIDYGFTSLGSNDAEGVKSRQGIDSGISKANRIGFKGAEDLGNGLKAVFVLETGLNGDQSSLFNDGKARQSYAGLAGGFGTVAFGRQYTPQHLFTSAVDPFGKNGFGSAGNVLVQDRRLDNLAAYISPSFGGFSFIFGYTFNGIGQENLENDGDARVWAFAPSFTWNNLFVGANYHTANVKAAHGPNTSAFNALDLYASYDFGFVKVGSTIGRRTTKQAVNPWISNKDTKLTQFMIGATFRITPNDSILTSYSRARENDFDNSGNRPRIGQWAIGYEHALSKRTVLYSQFAVQSHNADYKEYGFTGTFFTDGPVGSVTSSNGPNVGSAPSFVNQELQTGNQYRRGFVVGFRHDF
ncbi:MAG: porin [Betaproteobacteria bacterium]|nr:porin [Betaproteobacteria bacterium]